jgi:hypothetical protein
MLLLTALNSKIYNNETIPYEHVFGAYFLAKFGKLAHALQFTVSKKMLTKNFFSIGVERLN